MFIVRLKKHKYDYFSKNPKTQESQISKKNKKLVNMVRGIVESNTRKTETMLEKTLDEIKSDIKKLQLQFKGCSISFRQQKIDE